MSRVQSRVFRDSIPCQDPKTAAILRPRFWVQPTAPHCRGTPFGAENEAGKWPPFCGPSPAYVWTYGDRLPNLSHRLIVESLVGCCHRSLRRIPRVAVVLRVQASQKPSAAVARVAVEGSGQKARLEGGGALLGSVRSTEVACGRVGVFSSGSRLSYGHRSAVPSVGVHALLARRRKRRPSSFWSPAGSSQPLSHATCPRQQGLMCRQQQPTKPSLLR
jgi:hypothetical protein